MDAELVLQIVRRHRDRRGPLLPILHDLQKELGHVPASAVPVIADELNQSRAEIHGTISFYHDFRDRPPEKPVVKLCRAEACQARGGEAIAKALEADDRIALEAVYCLGLCASGPALLIGERIVARLAPETVVEAVARLIR